MTGYVGHTRTCTYGHMDGEIRVYIEAAFATSSYPSPASFSRRTLHAHQVCAVNAHILTHISSWSRGLENPCDRLRAKVPSSSSLQSSSIAFSFQQRRVALTVPARTLHAQNVHYRRAMNARYGPCARTIPRAFVMCIRKRSKRFLRRFVSRKRPGCGNGCCQLIFTTIRRPIYAIKRAKLHPHSSLV